MITNTTTKSWPNLKGMVRRQSLSAVKVATVLLLVITMAGACGPSDEELTALVTAEVERQVALVPPAPEGPEGSQGQQGLQGVEGPQGLVGPVGPQGLTGPQGPQGATGPQGRVGPAGSVGVQGPKGDAGPQGTAGAAGRDGSAVSIPRVLEVEELTVSAGGWGSLVFTPGDQQNVPAIRWISSGTEVATIWGGTTDGMILRNRNNDGSWTSVCIDEGIVGICR